MSRNNSPRKKNNWTSPSDLRAQVQKLWDKGELLTPLIESENCFPKRLNLKGPTSKEISENFEEVRLWVKALTNVSHFRIEIKTFIHQLFGINSIPGEAWIDSLDAALAMLGKRIEANRFSVLLDETRQRQPLLLRWLAKRPLKALELADRWSLLLDTVDWMQTHPRPGIYLRQVDIPGVNSKFIEAHRGVLTELFDISLPEDAIALEATGVGQFSVRYGFRNKPARIRFRVLDPSKSPLPGGGTPDITLDSASFARLPAIASRVFITENETNFLAFPPIADSLIIFGAGYGWDNLSNIHWLSDCLIYYWGDIDTHGFAILNQLRSRFSHVESFMMDRETLFTHESLWGNEESQALQDLPLLTTDEQSLFDALRDNRIRKNLRLEQEMIGFNWFQTALAKVAKGL
ncbi:DUF2220 family protein [Methylicorpusculum oleiharenae]|uniref:Wadjet anti-phage system protein JetD domain-containing protein n=1 Tax=Methylicorpusculum oleiharenae TaxID=1338687 RepID=UPI00135C0A4B|nr:Wadjet anti-phage system protein JetD domain-containing protein [Methylicorpusculum oleiharenae]MCD2450404.1 DUF2220 family protein [Methylicorpusculum oleiharenae]